MTAPFLATRGRSSRERSSRERYVLRLQKLAHSRTLPCSLTSALVLGFADPDPLRPIAASDLAACCVWLREGGPDEPPARRPRRGDGSLRGRLLLDRRRSPPANFRLGDSSLFCGPDDGRRAAEFDDRRLPPPLSRRGDGEAVPAPTSKMSLLEPSSLSLKIPSKLGRSTAASELFFRGVPPPALLPSPPLLRRRPLLLWRLERVLIAPLFVSSSTTSESFVGSNGTEVSFFDRRPSSRSALGLSPSRSMLDSGRGRHKVSW